MPPQLLLKLIFFTRNVAVASAFSVESSTEAGSGVPETSRQTRGTRREGFQAMAATGCAYVDLESRGIKTTAGSCTLGIRSAWAVLNVGIDTVMIRLRNELPL